MFVNVKSTSVKIIHILVVPLVMASERVRACLIRSEAHSNSSPVSDSIFFGFSADSSVIIDCNGNPKKIYASTRASLVGG